MTYKHISAIEQADKDWLIRYWWDDFHKALKRDRLQWCYTSQYLHGSRMLLPPGELRDELDLLKAVCDSIELERLNEKNAECGKVIPMSL